MLSSKVLFVLLSGNYYSNSTVAGSSHSEVLWNQSIQAQLPVKSVIWLPLLSIAARPWHHRTSYFGK